MIIDKANVEEAPTNRRVSFSLRRFSLWQLFVLVAIVALCLVGWLQSHYTELDGVETYARTTTDCLWLISSGSKENRLVFAVLEGAKRGVHSQVITTSNVNQRRAVLTKPDGTEVSLDGQKQLFEIVDGQYRDSDERVTLDQFKAFMNSDPEAYTIERLVEYVKSHK